MFVYIFTGILVLTFLISFKNDKRKLINAFLFLSSLGFIFISFSKFVYDHNLEKIHQYLMGFLYGVIPVSLFLFAVFMIGNGFVIFKKEGKNLANSLSILFGMGILFYIVVTIMYARFNFDQYHSERFFDNFVFYGYLILSFYFFVFLFIFFAFLAYSILYLSLPKNKDYDYIIIHGSGLIDGHIVPPLLASRIEKAIEAYNAATKEDVKLIASGGQGSDEKISEARAIADYLITRGIPEERIILEDKSTTTYENLKYSQEMTRHLKEHPRFIFVSNNYHVFRATLYAKRLHMNGEGVGAKTAGYYIPSAFLREYIAILNKIKWVLITISILFLLLIYISR